MEHLIDFFDRYIRGDYLFRIEKFMASRSTPEDSAIIVREEKREKKIVFVLHTDPGADQYLLRLRKEALAQAATLAERQHFVRG